MLHIYYIYIYIYILYTYIYIYIYMCVCVCVCVVCVCVTVNVVKLVIMHISRLLCIISRPFGKSDEKRLSNFSVILHKI